MNRIIKSLLVGGLMTAAASAHAESSVSWIPTNGLSYKMLQYGVGSVSADTSFMSMDLGIVAAFDGFYISADLDQALDDGSFDGGLGYKGSSDVMNLTIGCNCLSFVQDLTVFAGYTSIDTLVDGGTAFQESANDAGFFVGASYPFVIANSGQLTASMAYASLDGKSLGRLPTDDITFLGDTTGISYGISWTSSLSANVNYSLSAKVNDYTFDLSSVSNSAGATLPATGSRDRVFTILGAKVTYFF